MNFRKQESPICSTENIPLFVLYLKKLLPREEEKKVDKHIQSCSDCLANFAYIEEILALKHPLSADEKTLLLKYVTDPIWYQSINDAKKHIISEVRSEVKELLKGNIDTNNIIPSTNSSSTPAIAGDSKNKFLPKLQQKSPLLLTLTLVLILFSLSTGIYLAINKQQSSPTNPLAAAPITSTNSTAANQNLYQQLDSVIDQYLESKDKAYLEKATEIANEAEIKYHDKYGVDLISFYRSNPEPILQKALEYRKEFKVLLDMPFGDNYEKRLDDSKKLAEKFLLLGNIVESYRVKSLIIKLYVLNFDHTGYNNLISEAISYTSDKKYSFLKMYFLLWQAKYYVATTNYLAAQGEFEEVITISSLLEINEVISSASMSLAGIYHANNDDVKALELCQRALLLPQAKYSTTISLLHISGMSAFNLKMYSLSNAYFEESIKIAEKNKNYFLLSLSYTFLATIASEQQDFDKSESLFNKATILANSVNDSTPRIDLLSRVSGYRAKSKLLQKDYQDAAVFYQQTLEMLQSLGIKTNLETAQLNEGLATALEHTGNKKYTTYKALATNYFKQAQAKNERINCLLAFLPASCK